MEDIAPELLEQLRKRFAEKISINPKIRALYKQIQSGNATYVDAENYAYLVGEALSQTFGEILSSSVLPDGRMYYNIADRVIRPLLLEDHSLISDAAALVQKALNEKARIGIKPQTVAANEDRINGIIDKISNAEQFDDVAWVLDEPVKNFSMNVVDETLKANVNLHGQAGLSPKIIRKSEWRCCGWCSRLAGEYDYPDVPDDIYRRHERCRCVVDYDPGDGRRQNVHSKRWTKTGGNDIINRQTGADSGAKKTAGWEKRHADRYYEEIRNRAPFADAKRIASNIEGFSVKQIEDIRQHIFIRKQPRSGGYARFDSDYDIAQAWQRLIDGKNIKPSDKVLLMHEYEELTIMRELGCTYEEGHEKANLKYNWWKVFLEED